MIIGVYLKHIKAYKGINYIPIGKKYNFVSYIGENGSGKSSILEGLNSFFNNKPYSINKSAIVDGIYTKGNEPFLTPIFLVEKSNVTRLKKEFEKISDFFWNIEKKQVSSRIQSSMKEFFEIRERILKFPIYTPETHYLLLVGESSLTTGTRNIHFSSFHGEENFLTHFLEKGNSQLDVLREEFNKKIEQKKWKNFMVELKSLYSYIYLPVELDVESFTKIETEEMQKIFDKKLKREIDLALNNVDLDSSKGINRKLENFLTQIEGILENKYSYQTGKSRNNNLTKTDLINKILEVYFQKRVLYKRDETNSKQDKKVSELSAGEKRQAIIDLVYAFLKKEDSREKMIIIGIDEPENSLHISLCYEQFEKLKEVSKNNQILITTHWYGFLPIISEGYGHFLNQQKNQINFETYELYDYQAEIKNQISKSKNKIPFNFVLKSIYDLVQSIFHSIINESPYNWIICEGISEKIYFEHFFENEIANKKLRILPMGGASLVIRLYRYLDVPINDNIKSEIKGKVFCLIDTDNERIGEDICKNDFKSPLLIKRLSNKSSDVTTELLALNHSDTSQTDIEQSLNPIIFKKTMESLEVDDIYNIQNIQNENGNTSFIKNFENYKLENYFKENNGENKIIFSKKYVEIMNGEPDKESLFPNWINEIKKYFL